MLACKPEDSVLSYYVDLQELVWLGGNTLYGVISLTLPCALYWGTFRNLVGVKWQVAVSFSASFTVYHAGALCCLLCFCISHRPSRPLVCLLLWICSESTWLIHLLSSSRYLSTWPGASLTSVTSSREENSRLPFTTLQNLVFSILFSTSGSLLSQTSLKASGNWGFLWLQYDFLLLSIHVFLLNFPGRALPSHTTSRHWLQPGELGKMCCTVNSDHLLLANLS